MTTTATHRPIPAPRSDAASAAHARLRAATYVEFLLGHGQAPGVDLGSPVAYDRSGTVYSQRFARGLTLANVGPHTVEVILDHPYHDLTGAVRTSVVLAAGTAEVLRGDPA